jgi:hypothetical protein
LFSGRADPARFASRGALGAAAWLVDLSNDVVASRTKAGRKKNWTALPRPFSLCSSRPLDSWTAGAYRPETGQDEDPSFHRPKSHDGPSGSSTATTDVSMSPDTGCPGDEVAMRKAEIDALVRAHRGRTRPVAFFYVLRQPALEPDDHAFLSEHIDELGASDLLRWRARCEPGFTGPVIRQLARLAIDDPAYFKHEVLNLPRFELEEPEWIELAELMRGKVPEEIYERVVARCERKPARRASEFVFTPGVLKAYGSFLDDEDGPEPGLPAEPEGTRDLSMAKILAARRAGSLQLDDKALLKLAMERACRSGEDWSVGILEFPEILRDAIFEKARRTARGGERANLLGWLEAHGAPRGALLEIALGSIRAGGISYPELSWLTTQLTTRTAWEKHGLETLTVLMAKRAFAEISELIAVTWSEAGRDGKAVPRGFLEAIQGAFALTLLGMAREALAAGDEPHALATLSALACLDPPSRVSRAVHDLRRFGGVSSEIDELIAVNERLVKHSDARDASLEGVVAALHAIADAFG